MDTATEGTTDAPSASPAGAPEAPPARGRGRRRRRRLAFDLTALALVGVLLIAALAAGGAVLYRELYSPGAFVSRYLDLLARGDAAAALEVPGVALDAAGLQAAGLPDAASDALLRRAALTALTDAEVTGSSTGPDGVETVTVSYAAGPHRASTSFRVVRDGWIGVAPAWRFAQSPLSAVELTLRGATRFSVNGFALDTRQISPGATENPLEAVPMLVFSPGLYVITVDTPISTSPGVAVLSDAPATRIPVDVQTQPTAQFTQVVQDQVDAFLTACATQQVLQPTGCPFGLVVQNRIVGLPTWAIAEQPVVTLAPDGANWAIARTQAVAHITVDIRSIYDGSIRHLDEAVPFWLSGTVTVLPDGTASIQVTSG